MDGPSAIASDFSTDPLEDLLMEIAAGLQLAPSIYDEAEARYVAVAEWLAGGDRLLAPFDPIIYPQGSAKIGTLVRPIVRNEHDIDLVLHLRLATLDHFNGPTPLLDAVEAELRASPHHASLVERKRRCVRLQYADRFHLDVLPTLPDFSAGPTAVFVPDRELLAWVYGDPKGFAAWFAGRSRISVVRADAEIEALPEHQGHRFKTPLQVVVQLFKRWRDRQFSKHPELAPVSILLTTLAAAHYACACRVQDGLSLVLDTLCNIVAASRGPFTVPNPVNPKEDFSECWKRRPEAYSMFVSEIHAFRNAWDEVLRLKEPKLSLALAALFGDQLVDQAQRRRADRLSAARTAGAVAITAGGLLLASSVAKAAVRPNTFYGDR